ncbi:hypothetical protein C8Q70DRAFT_1058588 [Cubamyces menziesii]|nr:hypothetical protein C8Q70DRAFT_1058588 [Cubamyces menziesii]
MANTRRKNATAHPGYIDLPTPKQPSAEVAKEKAQKEQAKEAAVQKKAASVRKVAELEKRMEEEDAKERSTHVTRGSAKKAPARKGKGSTVKAVNVGKGGANKRKKAITAGTDGSDTERDNNALQLSQSEGPEVEGDSELTELEDTPRPPKKRAKQDKPSLREVVGTAKANLAEPLQEPALAPTSRFPSERSGGTARSTHAPMEKFSLSIRSNVQTHAADAMDVDDEGNDATQVLGDWLGDRGSGGSAHSGQPLASTRTSTSTEQSASIALPRTKATPATPFAKSGNPSLKPATKSKPQPKSGKSESQAAGKLDDLDVADVDGEAQGLRPKPKPKPRRAGKSAESQADSKIKGPVLELSDGDDDEGDNDGKRDNPKSKPATKKNAKSQAAAAKAKGLAVTDDDADDTKHRDEPRPKPKPEPKSKKNTTSQSTAAKANGLAVTGDDGTETADNDNDGAKRGKAGSKPKPKPRPAGKSAQSQAARKIKGPVLELSDDDEGDDDGERNNPKPKPAAKRNAKSQAPAAKAKNLTVTDDDDADNSNDDRSKRGQPESKQKQKPKPKPKKSTSSSQSASAKATGVAVTEDDDDADRPKRGKPELKSKLKPIRKAVGKVKGPILELSDDYSSDNNDNSLDVGNDGSRNQPKRKSALKERMKHQGAATSKARHLSMAEDEDETRHDRPKPKPKPKSTRKKGTSSQPINKVLDKGLIVSGGEDEERNAAMSSPVKAGARLTSSNLVAVEDLDVTTPNPVRIKVKTESLDDHKVLLADKGGSTNGAKREKKESKAGKAKTGASVKTLPRAHSTSTQSASASSKSLTSRASEDADSDIEMSDHLPAIVGKRKWTTGDLPPGAQNDDRWNSRFVPTLYEYQGSRHDPWTFGDASSVDVVQAIWDKVYGDSLPHKVVSNDNVHGLAIQKIYDWRSGIASAAIAVFERCFNASERTKYTVDRAHKKAAIEAARSAFCIKIHHAWGFVYRDPLEKTYPGHKRKGLFHSPFVLPIILQHLQQTKNSISVPELYRPDDKEYPMSPDRPIGAIGLIAAAVERVVCLWMSSEIVLRHDGRPYRPKKRNTSTGKDSCTKTDFSASNFLSQTTHFKKSAHRLSGEHMMKLLSAAVNQTPSNPLPPITQLGLGEPSLGRDELVEGFDSDDEVSITVLVSQGQPRDPYDYYDGDAMTANNLGIHDSDDNDSDNDSENDATADDNSANNDSDTDSDDIDEADNTDEADNIDEADDVDEADVDEADVEDVEEAGGISESDDRDTDNGGSDDDGMDVLEPEGYDDEQVDEDDLGMLESGDDRDE